MKRISVNLQGEAALICPVCGKYFRLKPQKEYWNRPLKIKCDKCKNKIQLIFDTRSAYRKEGVLPGILLAPGKDVPITILDLSETGASIKNTKLQLQEGDFYKVKIKVKEDWIEILVRIARVSPDKIGVEFFKVGNHERKIVGFYLLQ